MDKVLEVHAAYTIHVLMKWNICDQVKSLLCELLLLLDNLSKDDILPTIGYILTGSKLHEVSSKALSIYTEVSTELSY